jgi:hypothetical protein
MKKEKEYFDVKSQKKKEIEIEKENNNHSWLHD